MSVISSSGREGCRTHLTHARLLLMVRDADAAVHYQNLFQLFGIDVLPVFCASDVLATLRKERPDVVACCIDAPDNSGLHLIRRIRMRSRLDGGGTPAIALTDDVAAETHTKALLAGFQAYVRAEPMELLFAVTELMRKGRTELN